MHIISRKTLKAAATHYPDVEAPLDTWYRTAKKARWRSLADVRQTYPHADAVDPYTVFNIKGNAYRLIVKIEYPAGLIFIHKVLTHADYDKDRWRT